MVKHSVEEGRHDLALHPEVEVAELDDQVVETGGSRDLDYLKNSTMNIRLLQGYKVKVTGKIDNQH